MSHTSPQFSTFFSGRARLHLKSRRRSAGYAALAIMAVIGVVAATMMVTTLNASALKNDQDRKTGAALALAKQALIGRAASDAARPGSLPCPDVNNDGVLTMNVDFVGSACVSYVGRLPWKALGLPDLRDADGERLWYALSPNFRDLGNVIVNSSTQGTIAVSVSGNTPVVDAVAIIFAAGKAVGVQDRSGANVNVPAQFLEGGNGASWNGTPLSKTFLNQAPDSNFNDRLLPVMPAELSNIVQKRVGKEIATALDAYYLASGSVLPYAADPDTCPASGSLAGCVSIKGSTSPPLSPLLSGAVPAVPNSTLPDGTVVPPSAVTAYATSILGATPSTGTNGTPDNTWFNDNGWRALIVYEVTNGCASAAGCKGGSGGFKVSSVTGDSTTTVPDSKVTLRLKSVNSGGTPYVATTQNLLP